MTDRLWDIRETVMSHATTRASAAALVEAILGEISDLDADEQAPEWVADVHIQGLSVMTVGELRDRLRGAIEEIARRDRPVHPA